MNRINLRDLIDFDYVNKLSDKEKEFLNQFSKEYYSADFRDKKAPIHKSKKSRLEIYRNNNSRNQDTTAYLGNFNQLESVENVKEKLVVNSNEDTLIDLIDAKKKLTSKA